MVIAMQNHNSLSSDLSKTRRCLEQQHCLRNCPQFLTDTGVSLFTVSTILSFSQPVRTSSRSLSLSPNSLIHTRSVSLLDCRLRLEAGRCSDFDGDAGGTADVDVIWSAVAADWTAAPLAHNSG